MGSQNNSTQGLATSMSGSEMAAAVVAAVVEVPTDENTVRHANEWHGSSQKNAIARLNEMLLSTKDETLLAGASGLRRLLANAGRPVIDQVLAAGALPRLVALLCPGPCSARPEVQCEAAWAVSNIGAGTAESLRAVVECGAIPLLVELMDAPDDDTRGQAVWALGNLVRDSTERRDAVLRFSEVLPELLRLLKSSACLDVVRSAAWTLSIICRGNPKPPAPVVRDCLAAFSWLIATHTDWDTLTEACWTLSALAQDDVQILIDAGVCHSLITLLSHNSPNVKIAALRTAGNIVMGNAAQTQALIDAGVLAALARLLLRRTERREIRKEACWMIANISAESAEHVQAVIDAGLISPLCDSAMQCEEHDVRKEAMWALSNAARRCSSSQIRSLVNLGALPPLCEVLWVAEDDLLLCAVRAVGAVLRAGPADIVLATGSARNPYADAVAACGGVGLLRHIALHEDRDVGFYAATIAREFFGVQATAIGAYDRESHSAVDSHLPQLAPEA